MILNLYVYEILLNDVKLFMLYLCFKLKYLTDYLFKTLVFNFILVKFLNW